MQPEVKRRIERKLDLELGRWTRVCPWRGEIVDHWEDAYLAAVARGASPSEALVETGNRFGDVRAVADALRTQYQPSHGVSRMAIGCLAWGVLAGTSNLGAFFQTYALLFALFPWVLCLGLDLCQGSVRWSLARRAGLFGALLGALSGMVLVCCAGDPNRLGWSLALSLLSALYGTLIFAPNRPMVLAFMGIVAVDMVLLAANLSTWSGYDFWESLTLADPNNWGAVQYAFLGKAMVVLAAILVASVARFGASLVAQFAPAVGGSVLLIGLIVQLADLSDPHTLLPHLIVIGCLTTVAVAACHTLTLLSHFHRRVAGRR